jgi:predicted Zn-dependent peptidase
MNFILRFIFTLTIYFLSLSIQAEVYSPAGMNDLERLDLSNGFTILTKKRDHASNVSIRLAVGVGFDDFDCKDEELPHLIEHLMFSGTSNFSETDIEQLLDSWGGFSNASTTRTQTVYEFDVHSLFQVDAIKLMHDMLTNTQFSQDRIQNSIDIVHRESGNTHSQWERWAKSSSIFDTVSDTILAEAGYRCRKPPMADQITRQQIQETFKSYYRASNMTLIIVGKLNPETKSTVIRLFGDMLKVAPPVRKTHTVKRLAKKRYENGIWPLVGNQAEVGFLYEIPGQRSDDFYSLDLLSEIFNSRIYEVIRIDQGLSYNPVATVNTTTNGGFFEIAMDVDRDKLNTAITHLQGFMVDVIKNGLDVDRIERNKQGKLVAQSILYETNSDLAEYYVSSLENLEGRSFRNIEAEYRSIGKEELETTIKKYLSDEPIIAVTKPLMTYKFFLLVVVIFLLTVGVVVFLVSKRIYSRKSRNG